jgi:hypothetical protein
LSLAVPTGDIESAAATILEASFQAEEAAKKEPERSRRLFCLPDETKGRP